MPMLNGSGVIGGTSGRPDSKFYDAIYAGDVIDLRLSARRKSKNDILQEAVRKAIAGEMRGAEGASKAIAFDITGEASASSSLYANKKYYSNVLAEKLPYASATSVSWTITTLNKGTGEAFSYDPFKDRDGNPVTIGSNAYSHVYYPASWGDHIDLLVTYSSRELGTSPKSQELLRCDIIGDPANYYSGQTYTNTGASQVVDLSAGDVIYNAGGSSHGSNPGIIGHYYRRLNTTSGVQLDASPYGSSSTYADLGATYDGQTWTNDGNAQVVDLVIGDVIYNQAGSSGGGIAGHYYRQLTTQASQTLNAKNYDNTANSADLGTVYRGQQWTNDGSVQIATIAAGDVVYNEAGSSGGGIVGNFYKRVTGNTVQLDTTDYSSASWTDLGPNWNESPAAGSWLQDGVPGFPLLTHPDTGESLIPDGASMSAKASRKVKDSVLTLSSDDNGVTWGTTEGWHAGLESSANALNTAQPSGRVLMLFYLTDAHFTEPAVNAVVDVLGDVFAGSWYKQDAGSALGGLISKVLTCSASDSIDEFNVEAAKWVNKLSPSNVTINSRKGVHNPTRLGNPSASPAIKTLSYLTHENGQNYLQFAFKEMIWDTSADAPNEFVGANATASTSYTAGVTYWVSGLDVKKALTCVASVTIVMSTLTEYPDGTIRGSTGVTYFTPWNGNGWGDDNTFNIVDNTDTTIDDNGNTILIGQARVALPYLTGEDN